ncbi:SpoIIE family protein phosphatase [Streptomyces sp. L7]
MDLPPAQLLRNLDDLAQRLGDTYLATCLYVVYDPIAGELHIGNAGHIPPVIVRARDGRSELLDLPTGAPHRRRRGALRGGPCARGPRRPAGDVHGRSWSGCAAEDIGVGTRDAERVGRASGRVHGRRLRHDHPLLNTRGGRKDDVALLMTRLNGIEAEDDVAEWRLALDPAKEVA